MFLETAPLEHAFNQLSRDINDEFPQCSIVFVFHQPGGEDKALKAKADSILAKPGGQKLLSALKAAGTYDPLLIKTTGHPFPFINKKHHYLGVCFIDIQSITKIDKSVFHDEEDFTKDIKLIVYQRAWPVISLWQKAIKSADGIHTRSTEPLDIARETMLADCFACLAMQLSGTPNVAAIVQKQRAQNTLAAQHRLFPEHHPFAITFDAVKVVIRHAQEQMNEINFFENVLESTHEVSEVFEDISLEKWQEFARKCQEMIWMDRSISETLGAATYSTEDAYIRSYASIIAELLNQDVSPMKAGSGYNPFTIQVSAEEAHFKKCEALFAKIIEDVLLKENPEVLLHNAQTKNDNLMHGKIIGWCAPALIETHKIYTPAKPDTAELAERLKTVFYDKLRSIKWDDIQALHTALMKTKRHTENANLQMLKERLEKSETLSYLSEYL